jgi:hypothetical protein
MLEFSYRNNSPRAQNEQSKTNCIKICIKTGNLKLLVLSPCRLSVENSSGGVYFQTLTAWSRFDYSSTVGGVFVGSADDENTHRRTAAILGR